MLYNIYCDESCHLEKDGFDIMVLGGITCPVELKKSVFEDIRAIKEKHGLSSWSEIKWTKVSQNKIELYIDLIDYFFGNQDLAFRGVVATGKQSLDHSKYNAGEYDIWYYKMYFYLLNPMIDPCDEYYIFIDIKDTKGGPKVKKLRDVLCNNIYDFRREIIRNISQINSSESEIIQLTDLLIGALSYFHRGNHLSPKPNQGKVEIINRLQEKYKIDLSKKTNRQERKFNLFVWQPRGV